MQMRKRGASAGLTALAPPSLFHPLLSTAQLSASQHPYRAAVTVSSALA